jgi:hypothetical protein
LGIKQGWSQVCTGQQPHLVGLPLFFLIWQVKYTKLLEMASFQLGKLLHQLAKTQHLASEIYQTVGDALIYIQVTS